MHYGCNNLVNLPPPPQGELHGAFVVSKVGNCKIASVDASAALAMPGVIAFIDHNDVPGANNVSTSKYVEEIFSSGSVGRPARAIE